MDFILEKQNLGLQEQNKLLFANIAKDISDDTNDLQDKEKADTFRMYSDFMKEKKIIIETINEMTEFIQFQCGSKMTNECKNITNIAKEIEYKNGIIMILNNYQEQPGLLNSILPIIVPNLMNFSIQTIDYLLGIKEFSTNEIFTSLKCLYQIVYVLCKIRGYSTIIKFFSSEVNIFESVITFLLNLNIEDAENWHILYVLLLWTSILGLVPFDIETIDTKGIIINCLIDFYKKTLNFTGNICNITAFSLSKFITRPDIIKKGILNDFINFCISTLTNETSDLNNFACLGVLAALAEIFKNGLPKDLINYISIVENGVLKCNFKILDNSVIFRKLKIKLTHRIGLVLLKPKFQKWRYTLQTKSLLDRKINKENKIEYPSCDDNELDKDELDYEIDFNTLETIIDLLLNSLHDKENIVRWSGAKGIGRLCERLPKQMVDDIFQSVLELFKDEENEYSWQGACLCIAELCKRGMILPEKLSDLIPFLEKALIFEINKGTFCSGSNVRDSACYVIWALARAYSGEIMKPHVEKLSTSLILTILFDKEVNCRRAASAAFQEHVGRQGYFPHGIQIITEADYFTLGNRQYCYLNISTFIAQYPQYYEAIVNYIAFSRLIHVELAIRQLAAEALALLVPFDPQLFTKIILPKILTLCFSNSLNVRHGAIIGIGYIVTGLAGKWDIENNSTKIRKKVFEGMNSSEKKVLADSDYRKQFNSYYDSIKYTNNLNLLDVTLISEINSIPETLDKKNQYKGKGGEVMRNAVNNLIRLTSKAKLPLNDTIFLNYLDVLLDNLKHPNPEIQIDGCNSIKVMCEAYKDVITNDKTIEEISNKFLHILKLAVEDENIYLTKGFTMVIPFFFDNILHKYYPEIIKQLFINSKVKELNNNDAETRKYALESLCELSIKFVAKYVKIILNI